MNERGLARSLVVAIAAATMLAGCAVLTVDVDVYKGPLANELHVQTQQVAVMAIGAKPLLEELEAKLDAKAKGDEGRASRQISRLIENVLSLYEDRRRTPLESKLEEIEDASQRAIDALHQYGGTETADYASAWAPYQAALRPEATSSGSPQAELAKGYARLLTERTATFTDPKKKASENVSIPVLDVQNQLVTVGNPSQEKYLDGVNAQELSSNQIWEVFEKREVVAWHAQLLFEDAATDVRVRFVDDVTGMARAFRESRTEMRRLVRAMAEAVVAAYDNGSTLSDRERQRIVRSVVDPIADLLSPDALIEIARLDPSKVGKSGLPDFKKLVEALAAKVGPYADSHDVERDRDEAKAALKKYFTTSPDKAAAELLLADASFDKDSFRDAMRDSSSVPKDDAKGNHLLTKYRSHHWRMTGLTAGSSSGRAAAAVARSTKALKLDIQSVSSSFRNGRTDEGIETLLERYLTAANEACREAEPAPCERERLMRALVQFSEKLRFLANNLLFVERDDGKGKELTEQFRTVLEAVANTIQVHVNELDRAAPPREQVNGEFERERAAFEMQGQSDPCTAIEQFIRVLEEELRAATAELASATEQAKWATDERDQSKKTADQAKDDLDKAKSALAACETNAFDAKNLVEDWKFLRGWFEKPDPDAERDLARLKKGDSVKAVLDLGDGILGEATGVPLPDPELRQRARSRLHEAKTSKPLNDETPDDNAFTATLLRLDLMNERSLAYLKAQEDKKATASRARDETASRSDRAAARTAQAEAAKTVADDAKAAAEAEKAKLEKTVKKVKEKEKEATKRLVDSDAAATDCLVQQTLASILRAEPDPDAEIISIVERERPAPLPKMTSLASNKSRRDVLDQLIAALRQTLVHVVADEGTDSKHAKQIRDALAAAYEQRSGMIYLRPTSAYLRTSYAVSALGSNAGSGWHNMLNDSVGSFVPFIGEDIHNGIFDVKGRQIAEDRKLIDAQFWQSVNHVRVAGGGSTNYVVVKDDLGNWYVKGYSSDPAKVIESAKNLALFNAGPARAALLSRGGNAGALAALQDSGKTGETVLGGQLKRVEQAYEKATRELRKDVVDALASTLATDIRNAWTAEKALDGARTGLDQSLDSAAPQLDDARKPIPSDETVEQAGDQIVDGLLAVKRFHHAVVAAIDANVVAPARAALATKRSDTAEKEKALADAAKKTANDAVAQAQAALDAAREAERKATADRDAAQTSADTAIRILTDLVGAKLSDRIQKRDKAITDYDAAIALIGGSVTK